MSTPYSEFLNSFHSRFQSKYVIIPDLEFQFFLTALGDYTTEIREIFFDKDKQEIQETLAQAHINLIGKLMYKAYLSRERDRVLKLNNIIGKDIKLTGMSDSKLEMNRTYKDLEDEILNDINKLKKNTYYE